MFQPMVTEPTLINMILITFLFIIYFYLKGYNPIFDIFILV